MDLLDFGYLEVFNLSHGTRSAADRFRYFGESIGYIPLCHLQLKVKLLSLVALQTEHACKL